jgi:hypothetical protein
MLAGAAALLAVVACLAASGCGGSDDSRPAKLGARGYASLFVELSKVSPPGSMRPQQAGATSARQAIIVRARAKPLRDGRCKATLETLGTAYDRFGKASAATTADADPQALVSATRRVLPAVLSVRRACA